MNPLDWTGNKLTLFIGTYVSKHFCAVPLDIKRIFSNKIPIHPFSRRPSHCISLLCIVRKRFPVGFSRRTLISWKPFRWCLVGHQGCFVARQRKGSAPAASLFSLCHYTWRSITFYSDCPCRLFVCAKRKKLLVIVSFNQCNGWRLLGVKKSAVG